jgi:hypothetical protein
LIVIMIEEPGGWAMEAMVPVIVGGVVGSWTLEDPLAAGGGVDEPAPDGAVVPEEQADNARTAASIVAAAADRT